MNTADFILIALITAVLAAAFYVKHLRKKNGKSSCCDSFGGCPSCAACASRGSCGHPGAECRCGEKGRK